MKLTDSVPTLAIPSGARSAVTFDLSRGHVRLSQGDSGRAVVVPAPALVALAKAAGPAATTALGNAIGLELGGRLRTRLAGIDGIRARTVEVMATELATELAVVGLGTLSLERWGRALVLVVDDAPDESDELLAAVLGTTLAEASGSPLGARKLAREGRTLRLLVAGAPALARLETCLAEGVSWGDALTRLHAPEATATTATTGAA